MQKRRLVKGTTASLSSETSLSPPDLTPATSVTQHILASTNKLFGERSARESERGKVNQKDRDKAVLFEGSSSSV
jgi:hypothetical protein